MPKLEVVAGEDSPVPGTQGLTPRQLEILALISKGLSNREVCDLLGISSNTVKVHVAGILRALGVANRTEAAAAYQQLLSERNAVGARVRAARRLGRPTIAVLPFAEHGASAGPDHLASGLVDDLITRLSGWRWFPVIASTSSSSFASIEPDLKRLRADLGAGYVITGSVRRSRDQLRVSAHLIETERGVGVWSGSFDAGFDDVLATQDEIARRIVACLAPELMEAEGRSQPANPEPAFEVWQLTMQGMWHLARRSEADVGRALEVLSRAVELDPNFSLAWHALTWVHHYNLIEQWTDDASAEFEQLARSAAECLRADPHGAPAQTAAGLVEMYRGNTAKAMGHLEKAARLNPSNTQALALLGQCYGLTGRPDECIATLEDALQLNPHGPMVWMYQGVVALAHFAAKRWDEAIDWSERALHGRPEMITAHLALGASLVERGDVARGREVIQRLRELRPAYSMADFVEIIGRSAHPQFVDRLRAALAQAGLS